jgi:DNA-binding response OmpR family regulator
MAKTKVLLAEDDATMVALLKILLKMEDFDVVALHADDDVLLAARAEKPDVLLLDLHLANQSGLDILDQIRGAQDVSDLPIVISSGSNSKEVCLTHGANGFVLKPYMPDELISTLKQAIKSV